MWEWTMPLSVRRWCGSHGSVHAGLSWAQDKMLKSMLFFARKADGNDMHQLLDVLL